ncbi:MAG: zinc carboxypeptidase [Candidatus Aminicenantes bacterium]|nr:zinc carboxypeptidase [Candidatus Aminicenantes bacterium]
MLRRTLRLLILVLVLAVPASPAGEEGQVISVSKSAVDPARLARQGFDLLMEKEGRVYIVAGPGDLAALASGRIAYTIEAPGSLAAGGPALSADGGLNGAFHSALELETDIRTLERDFPGLARVVEIGESLEGRKIWALKISDNASMDEGEPAAIFLGCHHAREWISVEVPFLFGKYLLENYSLSQDVRDLVDGSEIWTVPIVNPDGLEYSIHVYRYWRKNRRANADGTYGVDINRNYGYRWGFDNIGSSGNPGSDVYRGTRPFSEPETAAVRDLFADHDFRAAISFHSYSQAIMYPWGYTTDPAPGDAGLGAIAATMSGLMAAVNGTVYAHGQASRLLYTTNGDTVDWTYGLRGAPSFTIELPPVDIDGGGFFNDEAAIGAIFGENLPAMLHLARYALDHPLPRRRVPSPAIRRTRPIWDEHKILRRDLEPSCRMDGERPEEETHGGSEAKADRLDGGLVRRSRDLVRPSGPSRR